MQLSNPLLTPPTVIVAIPTSCGDEFHKLNAFECAEMAQVQPSDLKRQGIIFQLHFIKNPVISFVTKLDFGK